MLTLTFVVLNYTRCGIFGEITQPQISEQVVGYLKSVACALKVLIACSSACGSADQLAAQEVRKR